MRLTNFAVAFVCFDLGKVVAGDIDNTSSTLCRDARRWDWTPMVTSPTEPKPITLKALGRLDATNVSIAIFHRQFLGPSLRVLGQCD
ncbi:hypothetical protein BKA81DRAFT_357575 [Phyllosticta paracitricarpa]